MHDTRWIIALAAALGMMAASTTAAASGEPRDCARSAWRQPPFTMEIPPGFRLVNTMTGEDFVSYAVYRGSVAYVGLYVGNYPNIGLAGGPGALRDDPASGRKIRVQPDAGGERIVGYSIQAACPGGPRLIEAWAYRVDGDQDTADRLASTVRAKPQGRPR